MSPVTINERYARPVKSIRRTTKPFVLTSEGICGFIKSRTKTLEDSIKFLHKAGCTWDKDGKVTVHPI